LERAATNLSKIHDTIKEEGNSIPLRTVIFPSVLCINGNVKRLITLELCYYVWTVPLGKDDALNEDVMADIFSRYLVVITAKL